MKIIIVGCGKTGKAILKSMAQEGHDVVAVDRLTEVIDEITNVWDVMGVCGNGADPDVLTEAGVQDADVIVSATRSDEVNMLSCFFARRMGAKHTVCRVRDPEYIEHSLGFLKRELDLSMTINPERMAAHELFSILKTPSAAKIETFARDNFELVEIPLRDGGALCGMKLSELPSKYRTKVLVCAVRRGQEVVIPDGSFVLRSGDRIAISAVPSEIGRFLRQIGVAQKRAHDVMIVGGGQTAYYLARRLLASGSNVKIIEKNEVIAKDLCDALPAAVVIHGDGARRETLMEEGLEKQDALVTMGGIDEENILVSILAAGLGVPKIITKINRSYMADVADRLGLDSVVMPQNIVSDALVQYVRALQNSMGSNVETLYKVMDGKAEALEFNVRENPKLTGIPLKEMKLKSNILLAAIVRERRTIVPGGDDVILPNDKVIVISAGNRLQDLADIIG